MVAPVHNFHNFYPKIFLEGSATLRWAGRGQGTSYFISSSVCMSSIGKKKAFDVGGPSSIDFIYFWGSNEKRRSCDGRVTRGGSELKKTGARSARVRTHGQNPLVKHKRGPRCPPAPCPTSALRDTLLVQKPVQNC
jgi:hypothetical protein